MSGFVSFVSSARRSGLRARHAWVPAWILIVGAPLAYVVSSEVGQPHKAVGVLWIESEAGSTSSLMSGRAWVELLRSYQVLEPVVLQQGLAGEADVRDAARELSDDLVTRMDSDMMLQLTLEGDDPEGVVRVLDALMERHVELAAELKRRKLVETLYILEDQLEVMEAELMQAEVELERFLSDPATAARLDGPTVAIEEARLRRRIATSENLYDDIRLRIEDARLASASSIPDVRILDPAALEHRSVVGLPFLAVILLSLVGLTLCLSLVLGQAGAYGTFGLSESRLGGEALPALAILLGAALATVGTWLFFSS